MVHLLLATVFYLFGKLKPCCRFPLVFYEEKRFLLKNNPIYARKEEEMLVSNLNRRLWLIISIMQRMNWKQFAVQIFFFLVFGKHLVIHLPLLSEVSWLGTRNKSSSKENSREEQLFAPSIFISTFCFFQKSTEFAYSCFITKAMAEFHWISQNPLVQSRQSQRSYMFQLKNTPM